MKTAIIYASIHHKNTEKVVKAIAEKHPEVELIDATKTILKDLASYEARSFRIVFVASISSTSGCFSAMAFTTFSVFLWCMLAYIIAVFIEKPPFVL